MANINLSFKLKDSKSIKPTPIFVISYLNYERFKMSTGQKIDPIFWDHDIDFPFETIKGNKDQTSLNRKLIAKINELKDLVYEIERKADDVISVNDLKTLIKEKTSKTNINKLNENKNDNLKRVIIFLDQFIIDTEMGKRTNTLTGKIIKPETIKDYRLAQNQIAGFEAKKGVKLYFDDLTLDWYKDFLSFLNSRGYSPNYEGRLIKTIKLIMAEAFDQKLTTNQSYLNRGFKRIRETTDQVYLNEKELNQIFELNLKYTPNLDLARDNFLLACWTGLRISDLKQLRIEHIDQEEGLIRIKTLKTDTVVVIPLHWTVKEIIIKHGNKLPKIISSQKLNEYIKEICHAANIIDLVPISKTRGGKRIDTTEPKFSLVSLHTARRSFATNLYKRKIPAAQIMLITGHKSEKVFLQYIRVTPEENAELLKNHAVFSDPLAIGS